MKECRNCKFYSNCDNKHDGWICGHWQESEEFQISLGILKSIEYIKLDDALEIINKLPTHHNTIYGGDMFMAWDKAQKKILKLHRKTLAEKEFVKLDDVLNIISDLLKRFNTDYGRKMFATWNEAQNKILELPRTQMLGE